MNAGGAAPGYVGVDHGGLYIFMTEQFLNGADVVVVLEEMGSEGVPKRVGSNAFVYFGKTSRLFDRLLNSGFVQVMPPGDVGARFF